MLDLDVTGMTCASCAARIERKLDGVTASVNDATEKARVDVGATGLSVDDVIATIESVGYGARIHTTAGAGDDTLVRLRRHLNVAAIPLAMSGRLSPVIAGAAMAFSSVFVVTNSLRLHRFRPLVPGTPVGSR